MESQGLGIRAWGFGRLSGLLSTIFIAGVAGMSPMSGAEAAAKVTVRLFNYAPVSPERLNEAEIEASIILRRAGVDVEWLGCRLSVADAAKPAACQEALGPAALVLRILPSIKSVPPGFRDRVGFSVVLKDGGPSAYASVFYDRVEELAAGGSCSRAVILGLAMAHEIGHLLLGIAEHSVRGIMRARWEREDLRQAAQRYLLFSTEQAALMRADVRKRRTFAATAEPVRTVQATSR